MVPGIVFTHRAAPMRPIAESSRSGMARAGHSQAGGRFVGSQYEVTGGVWDAGNHSGGSDKACRCRKSSTRQDLWSSSELRPSVD